MASPIVIDDAPREVQLSDPNETQYQANITQWGREISNAIRTLSTAIQALQNTPPTETATATPSAIQQVTQVIAQAGANGWTPQFALVPFAGNVILALIAWTGGTGAMPTTVPQYVGPAGFTPSQAAATNLLGPSGTAGAGYQFLFSAGITAPPGTGDVLFDSATFASIANVYVSYTDRNGVDLTATLNLITGGSILEIFQQGSSVLFGTFSVTSITTHTGYLQIAVTPLDGGVLTDLQPVGLSFTGSSTGINRLTGDVTAGPGSGSQPATIAANAVTNAKLAQMAANSIKGNNTGGLGAALDLTVAQVKGLLAYVIGDLANIASNTFVANNTGSPAAPIAITVTQAIALLGLGTAAFQASSAFDAAGAAAAVLASSLQKANNLSDLASAVTARANLSLGTAATQNSSAFDAAGAATTAQTNAEAYALALLTAWNAINAGALQVGANKASSGADPGSLTLGPVGYATGGTVSLNFGLGAYDFIGLTVNGSFSPVGNPSSGLVAGRVQILDLTNTTGGALTLAWSPAWQLANGALPTSLAPGAYIRVVLISTGTTDAGVVASWFGTGAASGITTLTGDVTAGPGSGSQPATIAANAVTNAKLAQMAANSFKGNNVNALSNAVDLTILQARLMLTDAGVFNVMTYGAKGDGVTNDTTAVTNALAAAVTYMGANSQRAKLYFPSGTYLLRAQFSAVLATTTYGLTIEGDGMGTSVLQWDTAAHGTTGQGFSVSFTNGLAAYPNANPITVRRISASTLIASTGTFFNLTWPANRWQPAGLCIFDEVCVSQDQTGTYFNNAVTCTNPQQLVFRNCVMQSVTGGTFSTPGVAGDIDFIIFLGCNLVNTGTCLTFTGSATGGFEALLIGDCSLIGSTCLSMSTPGEVLIVRDTYLNPRGAAGFGLDIEGLTGHKFSRVWIKDNFFDTATVVALQGLKIRNSFEVSIHDNLFAGNAGASVVGAIDIDTTNGVVTHDNRFEACSADILYGASASDSYDHDNISTSSGSTVRTVQRTDNGTNNLTDVPVATSKLPASWPNGSRAFVTDATSTAFAAAPVGGGGNPVPVFYAGSWKIG